jgi:hypothetical protein
MEMEASGMLDTAPVRHECLGLEEINLRAVTGMTWGMVGGERSESPKVEVVDTVVN